MSKLFTYWHKVQDKKPPENKPLLIHIKNQQSKDRVIKAIYIPAKTIEAHVDSEWFEYDEEEDTYWTPQGWYEDVYAETGLEFDLLFIGTDLEPLHWMTLPTPPNIGI